MERPSAGCTEGSSPTTQSEAQAFNNETIAAKDCLWLNSRLVQDGSICAAAGASGQTITVSVSDQSIVLNGVNVMIPGAQKRRLSSCKCAIPDSRCAPNPNFPQ